jgi:hypothetical protein
VIATKNESEKHLFSNLDRAFLERLTTDLRTLLASMESPVSNESDSASALVIKKGQRN